MAASYRRLVHLPILIFVLFVILYLICGFVSGTWNVFEWHQVECGIFLVINISLAAFAYSVANIE